MHSARLLGSISVLLLSSLIACSSSSDRSGDDSKTDEGDDPDGDEFALKSGLSISRVTFNQVVNVDVVKDGKAVKASARSAPLVAGKKTLVRVFVTPDDDWKAKSVRAVLTIESKKGTAKKFEDEKSPAEESTDADLDSTFTFEVDAKAFPDDARFSVKLFDGKGKTSSGGDPIRYPSSGEPERAGVVQTAALKIVLVPVTYDADGSGRAPDISEEQLEIYRSTLATIYPASAIDLTVREPMSFTSTISANGRGFDTVLDEITALRAADEAEPDVYYYGAFTPTPSFETFCRGGCVAGLSSLNSGTRSQYTRASVGLGFSGPKAAETMVHELGHAHGRPHAPCGGAQSPDPDYPYPEAQIGSWGWDPAKNKLLEPTKFTDMMGYCEPTWISDFTYKALFDRIEAIDEETQKDASKDRSESRTAYRIVKADGTGRVTLGRSVQLAHAPGGLLRSATVRVGASIVDTEVTFVPYDHLPGGTYFVPDSHGFERIRIDGALNELDLRH